MCGREQLERDGGCFLLDSVSKASRGRQFPGRNVDGIKEPGFQTPQEKVSQVEEIANGKALRGGLVCMSQGEEEEVCRGKVEGKKDREGVCVWRGRGFRPCRVFLVGCDEGLESGQKDNLGPV